MVEGKYNDNGDKLSFPCQNLFINFFKTAAVELKLFLPGAIMHLEITIFGLTIFGYDE